MRETIKEHSKDRSSKKAQTVKPHYHGGELKRLSRIKGQVEGIERMIDENRYCPEIIIQIKAVRSALKGLELSILESHMKHCVKIAVASQKNEVIQQKLDEILDLLKGSAT